jgi:hypothetical protein
MAVPWLRLLVTNILAREIRERTQASLCGTFSGQNGSQVSPQVLLFSPFSITRPKFHPYSIHVPPTTNSLTDHIAVTSLHWRPTVYFYAMAVQKVEMATDTSHKLLNKTQIICARHCFTTTKSDNHPRPLFPSTWTHTPPILRPSFQANVKYKSHFEYFSCLYHYGLIK